MIKKIILLFLLYHCSNASSNDITSFIQVEISGSGELAKADLLVENSVGHKTGRDPIRGIYYNEINNSSYGDELDFRVNQRIIVPVIEINPAETDIYIINILGISDDNYTIKIYVARGIESYYKSEEFVFSGITHSGSRKAYKLFFTMDTTRNVFVEEIIPNLLVKLVNSQNQLIIGGLLQYYESGWKYAENHGDGTYSVNSELPAVKLRMTYAHGIQEMPNVPTKGNTVIFRTIDTGVKLMNSFGIAIDTGTVRYYSGEWHDFGVTSGGLARKELLPSNYKFRMIYAHASTEKYQDISRDSLVIFSTVQAKVELRSSQSVLIDTGIVKYYSGAWYHFGSTTGGAAALELLPNNYKFRMTYARGSSEKYQDIGTNSTVVFQTKNARVELRNSQGNLMDEGKVQYYSGAWYNIGTTSGGMAEMELLPMNYKFRMTYAKGSNEKYQDLGTNPKVLFQTINAKVELRNSLGDLMDEGSVQYYSGAWYNLGLTSGGIAAMELLPYNYKFRMTYEKGSNEKYQDVGVNSTVRFATVRATVKVNNAQDQPLNNADVKYYSGAWYSFGSTLNGITNKELLPNNYKFRAVSSSVSSEKYQDISENSVVEFKLNIP